MSEPPFFDKVEETRSATLLKKKIQVFPVNFAKFLRTPFLQNTTRRLLLWIMKGVPFKFIRFINLLFSVPLDFKIDRLINRNSFMRSKFND